MSRTGRTKRRRPVAGQRQLAAALLALVLLSTFVVPEDPTQRLLLALLFALGLPVILGPRVVEARVVARARDR